MGKGRPRKQLTPSGNERVTLGTGQALRSFESFCKNTSKTVKSSWNGDCLAIPDDFDLDSLVGRAVERSSRAFWTPQTPAPGRSQDDDELACIFGDSPLSSPEHTPPPSRPVSPPPGYIYPALNPGAASFSTSSPPPTPPLVQSNKTDRNKRRSREKRKAARAKAALSGDPRRFDQYKVPAKALKKYRDQYSSNHLSLRFDISNSKVASSSFVGTRRQFDEGKRTFTLEELRRATGFSVYPWDGHTPTPIHDSKGRLFALCGGQAAAPGATDWVTDLAQAVQLLEEARQDLRLPPGSEEHRRGHFTAVPSGISHGNGTTRPCNTFHSPNNAKVMQRLNESKPFRRIAGFGSSLFAAWFPGLYEYYTDRLGSLFASDGCLKRNFLNSVFPAATYNLGPSTVCYLHVDHANLPFGVCAITALGNYNPKLGGHLVLWDCGVIIEFPPGSTILIPSGVVPHMNVSICPGETRYSFTQYAAGGLFRWVERGFQQEGKFFSHLSDNEFEAEKERERARWAAAVTMFSNMTDIPSTTE